LVSGDFRRIAIIGCGLIGGSILLALRERQPEAEVIALDRGDDLARVRGADLVVLAVPIREIIAILPDLRPHLAPDALVTDTGSTKAAVVDAAAGLRFIGGHPIAGAAASGRNAARSDLFDGRPWILTPTSAVDEHDQARLRRLLESLGARVHVLGANEHDRLLAVVSHLPQLTVSALMYVAGACAGDDGLAVAGSGLRDSTRLASSPADIWRDIVATNRANVTAAIDALIEALSQLRDDDDGQQLQHVFESAARWKQILDERS
jgi:prephenate dehydrogenase